MVFDEEIHDIASRNHIHLANDLGKYFAEPLGSGAYTLPLMAVLFWTSGKNNPKNKEVALNGIKAFVVSGGFSFAAKQIFHRERPGDKDPSDPFSWHGPAVYFKYSSFPSGHTATIFAVATVLSNSYKEKKWVGIASYSLALLTGLSRVYDNEHWMSDVIAGAVLGTYIGHCISNRKPSKNKLKPIRWKYF